MLTVRAHEPRDWPAVWALLEPTFRAGETYTFARNITEAQARQAWVELPAATFVAVDAGGRVVGTYFLKPNQPGQGAHVCNCGYMRASAATGRGVARAMCLHSIEQARRLGFRAMQFNFVVASNTRAVTLWQSLGFDIVGRLPQAFHHPSLGYVDALVMFRPL